MGSRTYEPAAAPDQLHTLLERAGESGPYIMVGQGLGAAFATIYAAQFGGEVAGLVLIDPPSTAGAAGGVRRATRLLTLSPWLARAGALRATRLLSDYARGLPEPAAGALRAFLNRPDHLTRASRELSRWDETVASAEAAALAPTLHVARLDAAGREPLAFLTDPRQAEAVTAAIASAVAAAGHRP